MNLERKTGRQAIRWYQSLFLFLIILALIGKNIASSCTVAVISGKATPDGRPLLWKNRDASAVDNRVLYFKGPRFAFLGLINATDKEGSSVWAGLNSEGFAIINSASSDLADDEKGGAENGRFMRLALGECANVADFEALLIRTNGQRQVAANFGVIDAEGQAGFLRPPKTAMCGLMPMTRRWLPLATWSAPIMPLRRPKNLKGVAISDLNAFPIYSKKP